MSSPRENTEVQQVRLLHPYPMATPGDGREKGRAMFKSVLVALCRREESSPVAQQAIWLARREGARVLGLHVVDQEELIPPGAPEGMPTHQWRERVEPELRAIGSSLLDRFAADCTAAGVPAETRLVVGPLVRTVCRQAQAADLIVMGSRGDHGRRGSMLGCCPLEGVIRKTRCPVMVVAARPREIYRILMAYDGSPRARAALAVAARLAGEWQVPLTLLTVVEKGVGRHVLAEGQIYLRPYGLPEKALLREGNPSAEILRTGAEEDADLIVVGGYCHNWVKELIFGGTVGEVMRQAECPVLICR